MLVRPLTQCSHLQAKSLSCTPLQSWPGVELRFELANALVGPWPKTLPAALPALQLLSQVSMHCECATHSCAWARLISFQPRALKFLADKTWKVLEDAIHEIHNKNASGLSFEELYRYSGPPWSFATPPPLPGPDAAFYPWKHLDIAENHAAWRGIDCCRSAPHFNVVLPLQECLQHGPS